MARTVLCIVGARPNFMKVGPLIAALGAVGIRAPLIHTGQHYDGAMNDQFFTDLDLPRPDVNLEVGSGSHAQQTAEIMKRFEPVLDQIAPDAVLVVGDVNSTIACSLVAAKKGVRVIHVEAGLRSYDRAMPEEINRVLTDQISDILFTTEAEAQDNLQREGIDPARVHFVGNVMIDSLLANMQRAVPAADTLAAGGASFRSGYCVLTLHRPSNVDVPSTLRNLLTSMRDIAQRCPVVFPMHPRTDERIRSHGLSDLIAGPSFAVLPPAGYHAMLGLLRDARLVVTDSGGLQEESTALGIPCLTVRENTERPITVSQGSNTLVGTDPQTIASAFEDLMAGGGKRGRVPPLWDGAAAGRIAAVLKDWL